MNKTEIKIPLLKQYQKDFEYITQYAVDNNSIDSTGLRRRLEINISPANHEMIGWYNDITINIGGVRHSDSITVSDLLLRISMASDYLNAIILDDESVIGINYPLIGYYSISIDYKEEISLYKVHIKEDNECVHVLYFDGATLIAIHEELEILRRNFTTINSGWISMYMNSNASIDEKYNHRCSLISTLVALISMISIAIYVFTGFDMITIIGLVLVELIVAFCLPRR